MIRTRLRATVLCSAAFVAACTAPEPPPASPFVGLSELLDSPAERALYDAMRAYDDAQYPAAEQALQRALNAGLRSARDRATAHKLLAFITCTSERLSQCEEAFRAARRADDRFALSRSEAGHPVWGPVYRRSVAP